MNAEGSGLEGQLHVRMGEKTARTRRMEVTFFHRRRKLEVGKYEFSHRYSEFEMSVLHLKGEVLQTPWYVDVEL